MHHLQPEEKLCPFCAEVIKAAAVKCRYCHSELPPAAPPTEVAPTSEPVKLLKADVPPTIPGSTKRDLPPPPPPSVEPAAEAPSFHDGRVPTRSITASWTLTAVLLIALAAVAFVGLRLQHLNHSDAALVKSLTIPTTDSGDRSGQASVEAREGVVTSDAAKTAALVAGTNAVQTVLSYSAATLPKDKAAADAVLAPNVRKEYDDTMTKIGASTLAKQVKVEATVVAASIITATDHDAKLLLFVNQTTTSNALKVPRVDQNRVVVSLHRADGEWSISDLNAL